MKLVITLALSLLFLLATLWVALASGPDLEAAGDAPAVFDPGPKHLWNRLYGALVVRTDQTGAVYGADDVDPLLWPQTEHLLTGPSHRRALNLLDEFLKTHAENLIRDPAKRALLQHSLWAIFDWSALRGDTHTAERTELQVRLAKVMRRLALTPQEIKSLPDNYAQAVASGGFAREYDAANRNRAFLPPDLLQPRGPWVCIKGDWGPVAESHVIEVSGRSRFFVFVRLPQGRKETLDYFRTLWNFSEPWVKSDLAQALDPELSPELPQFPVGTEVALLRQMMLIDDSGAVVPSPITESLQIRVYRTITSRHDHNNVTIDWPAARTEQDFYETRFSQAEFLAGHAGGLRAVGQHETEFPIFQTEGSDFFEQAAKQNVAPKPGRVILSSCVGCHSAPGIKSVRSCRRLLKPNRPQIDPDPPYDALWWETGHTADWKSGHYDWGLLTGYWRAGNFR